MMRLSVSMFFGSRSAWCGNEFHHHGEYGFFKVWVGHPTIHKWWATTVYINWRIKMALSFAKVNEKIRDLGVELVRERERGVTKFYFQELPTEERAPMRSGFLPMTRVAQFDLVKWEAMAKDQAAQFQRDRAAGANGEGE
jgi:hypothetical protein